MTWTPAPKGMETRAKNLKDFTMWDITHSCVKFFDLCDAIFSKFRLFWSNFSIASTQVRGKGFSKFNDEFAMSLFYDQIRQNLSANIQQTMPSDSPFIAISLKKVVSSFFFSRRTCSFERFLKPIKEFNISVGDFKNRPIMAIFIPITWFIFKFACMKTSFSIYYSGKISKMKRIVDFWFIKNSMFVIDIVELHTTS